MDFFQIILLIISGAFIVAGDMADMLDVSGGILSMYQL
jgi:hypothetical protein